MNNTLLKLKNTTELLNYAKKIVDILENPYIISESKDTLIGLGIELLALLNGLPDNEINLYLGKKAIETYQEAIIKML